MVTPALKRARTSGELARLAGRALHANPYRKSSSTRSPRRGSWSEAFARQWALGWKEVDEQLRSQPVPVVPGEQAKEVSTRPRVASATSSSVPAKASQQPT